VTLADVLERIVSGRTKSQGREDATDVAIDAGPATMAATYPSSRNSLFSGSEGGAESWAILRWHPRSSRQSAPSRGATTRD
jgi:hypothetical protein